MTIGDGRVRHIYTSVDIGSDTMKVVVFELYKNKLNLLAASSVKSTGIKKGVITDFDEASVSIKGAFTEIEQMLGIKITRVIANIPSYFSDYIKVEGTVKIEGKNGIVDGKDISSAFEVAIKNKIMPNREMVTIVPIDFTVDDSGPVKDPKGLVGQYLKVRAILITVPTKNIYSVVNLIEHIGVEVIDISIGGLGDICTFRNDNMDKQIGSIINIGAETTSITLYNKGIPVKNAIIQYGGKSIENDISYMYKVDASVAKNLKETFSMAHKKYASNNEFREVTDIYGNTIKVNQFEISEIVMSRVEEILTLAKEQIKGLTNKEIQYIILTGGSSSLPQLKAVANEILGNVTIGNIKLVGVRNNKFSSAIGNIIFFINRLKLKGHNYSMVTEEECESTSKRSRTNSNETMLGKVFGYFLGE